MSVAHLRAAAEERLSTPRLNVDSITEADVQFIASFLDALDAQEAKDAGGANLAASPLREEVALWRAAQQGTIEDFEELDRILSRYRNPDTAIAHILTRVAQPDVPLHVAADIDQIVWEQDLFDVKATYALAPDEDGEWAPRDEFVSEEEARAAIATWMKVHVIRRIVVESRV